MARSLLKPEITTLYDHLLQGEVGKAGTLSVSEGDILDGTTIENSELRRSTGVSVIAIERKGEIIINPSIDETIKGGDTLIVMGHQTK